MFHALRLAYLRNRHRAAFKAARAYSSQPAGDGWNVRVQMALDARECEAGNRLAAAINPRAILRAF